jgi:hypothetical protein
MRLGDAPEPHVPAPRSPDGLAEAVPIGGRPGTAVLHEVVVPPWLRMPSLRLVTGTARPVTAVAADRSPRTGAAAPVRPVTELAARRATVHRPAVLSARPRIEDDPAILGLSRLTRGRVGSRLFTLFFVGVFTLIALQTVLELLYG